MRKPPHVGGSKSRTRHTGNKRPSTNVTKSSNPRKRRRHAAQDRLPDLKSTENSFSALSNAVSIEKDRDSRVVAVSGPNLARKAGTEDSMVNTNLGRNRLAMGFTNPQTNGQQEMILDKPAKASTGRASFGESSMSPIEISDDEMEDSEGGIVINIDQDTSPAQMIQSDDEQSQESGEITPTPEDGTNSAIDDAELFIVDPTPTMPTKRLNDISASAREEQLKYAFFHLDRDRIDLQRPVICLDCFAEGHLHDDCNRKSTGLFPAPKIDSKAQVKLWISCCVCASKAHLVGDCPEIVNGDSTRWSLQALRPEQIVNLSLATGTGKLEKEAENNGMRPAGLQIRGRAGLHHAGAQKASDYSDEDDEPFLRQPVKRRRGDMPPEPTRSERYDRFDPPSDRQQYRGGGKWYATDSFGRQRSRSPDDRYSYRPRDDYARQNVNHSRDNWRPPAAEESRAPYRGRAQSPPRPSRAPTALSRAPPAHASGPNTSFSLPTRKGSNNTWSQNGNSGTSTPNSNNKQPDNQQSKKRKTRNKKKGSKTS